MIPRAEIDVERIRELSGDRRFIEAVRAFYERFQSRIDERRPTCRNRGVCCRFGEFGHRLFVTPVELAFFAASVERELHVPQDRAACPYQIDGLCSARAGRPMGCRVFFCESAGQGWQEELTEDGLAELRRLHEEFAVPYAYVEWLEGLERMGQR